MIFGFFEKEGNYAFFLLISLAFLVFMIYNASNHQIGGDCHGKKIIGRIW